MEKANASFDEVAPDVWLAAYPLTLMGADLRRNTTIIRLPSGKLVIHSSAPFSAGDIQAITALGRPGWLVDVLLRHDTFAKEARQAFPDIPYLAPDGFYADLDFPTARILPAPEEWNGDLRVFRIEGAPSLEEHVVFHPASRTLIVADLLMNFGPDEGVWTEVLLKLAAVAGKHSPGMIRLFKASIQDEAAFSASIGTILGLDFDRIIVGHGDIIPANGKALLADAVRTAGFDIRG